MAFTYRIDALARLVWAKPSGRPTLADWQDLLQRLSVDPAVQPGFGILSDRRHILEPPENDYVRGSIAGLASHGDFFRSRRIAILTRDLATYGMARMAEVFAEERGLSLKAFQDEGQAISWVTAPLDEPDRDVV